MNKFTACVLIATGLLIGYANADTCVVCDSENDEKCVQDPASIMPRNCRTQAPSGCYTRIVGTRTLRGCIDEMDSSVAESCKSDMNCEICQSLDGNSGCNSEVYPRHRITCHQCSGSLKSNCSVESVNPKPCRTYIENDRCYIRKTKDDIERGCLSDSTRCPNGNACLLCDGHGCNYKNANSTDIPLADSSAMITVPSTLLLCFVVLIASKMR